jgi:ABC-2 type transport system permease protein
MTETGSSYLRYVAVSFSQALVLMVRRRQPILLGAVALVPVLLPLGAYFLKIHGNVEASSTMFSRVAAAVYLQTLSPLIALFFGCSLVSEDVESQTITHILTRPVPRSAWVLGKFLAFNLAALLSLGVGLAAFFAASLLVGRIEIESSTLLLLLRFIGIIGLALLAYSALCAYFGSSQKRPIILSLVVIYGWQKIALLMPGVVDFLTIEKYVKALLPGIDQGRSTVSMTGMLFEMHKTEFLVSTTKAITALLLITILFLALTVWVVRRREYTSARVLQD